MCFNRRAFFERLPRKLLPQLNRSPIMASAEAIVSLYLALADANPEEAKANVTELSRRITRFFKPL